MVVCNIVREGGGGGAMGDPPHMNAGSVCLSVRYGFFLPAQVSLYTAKRLCEMKDVVNPQIYCSR